MSVIPRSVVSVATALAAATAWAGAPAFVARVLPVPLGCHAYAQWHGLAPNGDATAVMVCEGSPDLKAIAWTQEARVELDTLGGPNATPYGVGPYSIVVGTAETPEMYDEAYHITRPVIWEGGAPRDLGTLGGPIGGATAISAHGVIVGASQPEEIDPALERRPMRACAWTNGRIRDLGTLGGPEAYAYDVNARGWVVGSSATSRPLGSYFEEHAFVLRGRMMLDLGTLGGPFSIAWALNDRGDVVGYSYTGDPPQPGRLSFRAFVWRRGAMRDLGTLGGTLSLAFDVNEAGDIVGWSRLPAPVGNASDHAVLWRHDAIIDLNEVVAGEPACVLTSATAINARGQILANARCDDGDQVVVLEPR